MKCRPTLQETEPVSSLQKAARLYLSAWLGKPVGDAAKLPDPDEYVCAACCGTFKKGWTEEDAAAERKRLFPNLADENAVVICDDCFKEIGLSEAGHQ